MIEDVHPDADERPDRVALLALRTRSLDAREALARAASRGTLGDVELLELALASSLPARFLSRATARHLAALALCWAGQGRSRRELDAAALTYLALFDAGVGGRLGARHHRFAAQTLFLTDRVADLDRLLPELTRLPPDMQPHLAADLANPYRAQSSGMAGRSASALGHQVWEELLSQPFTDHGHAPLVVKPLTDDPPRSHPFDQLEAPGSTPTSVDGPTVTVIMPCYRPDQGLLTSLGSITAQTYGPLQILLMDDASGPVSEGLFEQAEASDDRVSLIRMSVNGGSYLARNEALRWATGQFVTFQDDDDWSHPERIATQVALLGDDQASIASHCLAVRAHDDLTQQWLGYPPVRVSAVSLLARSSAIAQVGPFLAVRKGADSEYAERLAAEAGPIASTGTPLSVYRLRAGSLSRGDFRYQWMAPDRLTFRGAYRASLRAGRVREVPVPVTFAPGTARSGRVADRLDVAYLGDFSADPAVDAGRAAELWNDTPMAADTATATIPPSVGVWHLERPWPAPAKRPLMHHHWFDRIVTDPAWQALSRIEPVHVRRLVVLDPAVLVLAGDQECAVSADRVELRLWSGDLQSGAGETPVDLCAVEAVARRWFGVTPVRVPA